jgi:hypothetical protein
MKASDFKPDDAVLYVPSHAHGDRRHPDCEHGVVRSQNGSNVFVRYWKNGVLQSTAQSTSPEDLVKGGEKLMTVAEEMAAAREKIAPPSHEELLKQARWMVLHPDTPASQRPMLMALLREIDLLELYRKGLSYDGNGHPHFDRAIAARAAEARIDRGDAVNLAMDWLENRPTLTPNGIQALCNAVMLMDKTLSSRPAIIEECARVCDEQYEKHKHYFSVGPGLATACATAIRALAPGGQNAAPQAGRKPCWFIERKEDPRWIEPWPSRNWTNDPLAARVFKSKADAELCIKEGQVYGSEAFATEHAWLDAPPAPAEVAEGAGEDLRKLALNLPVFDKNRNQFTVAMMQVAMEQAANCITDLLALRAAPSLSIDFDLLQTLQMRCNYIINGYSDAKLEAKEMGRLIGEALLAKVREAGK